MDIKQFLLRSRQGTPKRGWLFSFFALAMAISVLMGSASSTQSQTNVHSPSNPCGSVPSKECGEIRARAAKDVEEGIARRTSYVVEQYKELHPQWKTNPFVAKSEVGDIYDQGFTTQEELNKKDPQKAFQNLFETGLFVPVLLALAAIVGAILKDTLTQWVTKLWQAIANWTYARFAGTGLFRKAALKRYRQALVKKYKDLPILFRPNRPALDMSQIYVPLKVEGSSDNEQVDAYGAIAQFRRLVVTGAPGSGKSMLLKHIALGYGAGQLKGILDEPVPILLELHRLNDPELNLEKLITAFVEALERNDFPKGRRFVELSLQLRKKGALMLLLDGLDEVNSNARNRVVQQIQDLLDRYEHCRVIITCRTAVYHDEFFNETQQKLEVVKFSDRQIRGFLGGWTEMPPDKSIDQLLQTLRDRPLIMALARNPLLLTIIAYLYTDPQFVLPHSRAEFYEKSTDILLDQWKDKFNIYGGNKKRRVL